MLLLNYVFVAVATVGAEKAHDTLRVEVIFIQTITNCATCLSYFEERESVRGVTLRKRMELRISDETRKRLFFT